MYIKYSYVEKLLQELQAKNHLKMFFKLMKVFYFLERLYQGIREVTHHHKLSIHFRANYSVSWAG